MTCFWLFLALSLVSAPAAFSSGSLLVIIAWITQTCIQLILLPAIIVGQNLQAAASDARAVQQYHDVEYIKDQVNEHTEGGVQTIIKLIEERCPLPKS